MPFTSMVFPFTSTTAQMGSLITRVAFISLPGEYTVVVSVMDASGNSAEAEYVVYVNEQEVDLDPVLDAIENLESAIEDTEASLSDKVQESQDKVTEGQQQTNQNVADVKDIASDNTLVVVATVLAGVAA